MNRAWSPAAALASARPVWSAPAAMRAVRAAVVMPALFAFTDQVLGNLQIATFAAFGSFATLVLASFNGTRRDKLAAHLALALVGSVLLTIGTAVSSSTVLAVAVTLVVAFVVFFAGVAGPNAASGVTGAMLLYVLPAASPGTFSMVPDRLAGWWMASVAGTLAVMVLSPRPGRDTLRAAAGGLASALATALDAALDGEGVESSVAAAVDAKHTLLTRFRSTPFRPTALVAPGEALANSAELLEWCMDLVADAMRERADFRGAAAPDRELLSASAAALRDVAALFAGGRGEASRPDLEALTSARERSLAALGALTPDGSEFTDAARVSFHAHMIAISVLAITADALVASRLAGEEWLEAERSNWYSGSRTLAYAPRRVAGIATVALRNASVRSVWMISSVRGAIALAAAVAVADVTSVQHGFWVVLGTLSVLRTNAASTGSTALRALAGTTVGFVIGGALLLAIGSDTNVLWAVLPVAVLVAAYAPGTAPFAVGQAAFTVTVAVLFNLLVPIGWKVGVVRVEDVALGCAVSLTVGMVFWPRGLSTVVGDDLADAFRTGAAFLTQAVGWASSASAERPSAAGAALAAASRLDAALRAFLAEQGSKNLQMQELWRLVGGTLRLRLTALSITDLPCDADAVQVVQVALAHRASTLADWFDRLADTVGKPSQRPLPALDEPRFGPEDVVDSLAGSHYGVWLCEHLDHLAELVTPALHLAELRHRPWWRR